jgi:eukaryotic-like serine/threonine-protein kinase
MDEASIFLKALNKPSPDERAAFLDQACGGNDELRRSVELLLRAHDRAGGFLADSPAPAGATVDLPITELPGTVIGPYKLIEQIGEGGMGTVWMAQQTEPVKRLVALKLIKAGMDSKQVVARFEAERQALALMDHPNIARVLDGGTTSAGRPYFVMDLVKGVPITRYCDEHRLTPRQRLELFIPVCQAVQHAHQKGIIHRDLKPSNVLVALYDGKPVPKVIDFGVAKAAGQPLTEETLVTGLGTVVGTLEYMSPEQAQLNNQDIDTRGDVYSLGVLLYELLTGTTPLERKRVKEAGLLEALRLIREEETPRPSTRLGTAEELPDIAAQRGVEPGRLSGAVRGELDWIAIKALEKDRARRYETPNDLALDVQRYLREEPVQACPPSAGYRLRKFARRNRRALTTLALLGAMLLATAGSVGWALRDRTARQAAADDELRRVIDQANVHLGRGQVADAKATIDKAEWLLPDRGAEHHRRVKQVKIDLAMVTRLEEIRTADPGGVLPTERGRAHKERRAAYAAAFRDYGIDVESLDAAAAAERIRSSVIRDQLVTALHDWGWFEPPRAYWFTFGKLGPPPAVEPPPHLRAILRLADPDDCRIELRGPDIDRKRETLEALAEPAKLATLPSSTVILLARALDRSNAQDKAVDVLNAAHQRSPADLWLNVELAARLRQLSDRDRPSRTEEAAACLQAALVVRPNSAGLHVALGRSLQGLGRLDQAAAILRRALELDPGSTAAHQILATTLRKQRRWDEAIAVCRDRLKLTPESVKAHSDLIETYCQARQWENAIAALREADRSTGSSRVKLSWLLATCPDPELRNVPEALEIAKQEVEAAEKSGAANPAAANLRKSKKHSACRALGVAQYRAGKWKDAIDVLETAIGIYGTHAHEAFFLAMAHWQLGDSEQARQWYQRGVEWMNSHQSMLQKSEGTEDEARRFRAEAEKLLGIRSGPRASAGPKQTKNRSELVAERDDLDRRIKEAPDAVLYVHRARIHVALGQHDKAESDYTEALRLMPTARLGRVERARLYLALKQWDKACADFAELYKREPDNLESTFEYAGALVLSDDAEGCQRFCAYVLRRGDKLKCMDGPDRRPNLMARVCLLSPASGADLEELLKLAEEGVRGYPKGAWNHHTLGLAHYRAGRYQEARQHIDQSIRSLPNWLAQPVNWLILAMIHHQLGDTEVAQSWFDKAIGAVDKNRKRGSAAEPMNAGWHPHDWIAWLVLRREAQALFAARGD